MSRPHKIVGRLSLRAAYHGKGVLGLGCLLHRRWWPSPSILPSPQRLLAVRPTYSLLGFSAALAPKFTPNAPGNGRTLPFWVLKASF